MIPLWIWIIAVLLVVGIAMAVLLSSYENKRLTVEYYEIESEKIPEAFDGYRIEIKLQTERHAADKQHNQRPDRQFDEGREMQRLAFLRDGFRHSPSVCGQSIIHEWEIFRTDFLVYAVSFNLHQRLIELVF